MSEPKVDVTLDPAMAYEIAKVVREYGSEDMAIEIDDDIGDEAIASEEDLLEGADRVDPVSRELKALIDGLNVDAQKDLLALMWVGRGDFTSDAWYRARRQVTETSQLHVAQYLGQTPLASDYLIEGLSQMGYAPEDFEDG